MSADIFADSNQRVSEISASKHKFRSRKEHWRIEGLPNSGYKFFHFHAVFMKKWPNNRLIFV